VWVANFGLPIRVIGQRIMKEAMKAWWRGLDRKDRWALVTGSLQAAATLGMFFVALVGIWKVTPIITYQVQQQEVQAERASAQALTGSLTDIFAADALNWWIGQVDSFQRIVEVTGPSAPRDKKVAFQLVAAGASSIAPGPAPDLLHVTVTDRQGQVESIKVAVNEHAMSPSQYLQCRINQGVFAGLGAGKREKAEIAVERYIHRYMLPRVPPVHVEAGTSLKKLHDEIRRHQHQREEALVHLKGLKTMLDAAMPEESPPPRRS